MTAIPAIPFKSWPILFPHSYCISITNCWSSRLQLIVRFSIGWQWWFATYSSTSGGATLLASLLEVAEEKIQQNSTAGSINGDCRSDLEYNSPTVHFLGQQKEKAVAQKKPWNHGEVFQEFKVETLGWCFILCSSYMFIYRYHIFQDYLCVNSYGSLEIHPLGDAVSLWILVGE